MSVAVYYLEHLGITWKKLTYLIHQALQSTRAVRRLVLQMLYWPQATTRGCYSASANGCVFALRHALFAVTGGSLFDARERTREGALSHSRQKHGQGAVLPGTFLQDWTETVCPSRQQALLRSCIATQLPIWRRKIYGFLGQMLKIACYRVLEEPDVLYELQQHSVEWTLVGIAD